jgi:hypothetical protein
MLGNQKRYHKNVAQICRILYNCNVAHTVEILAIGGRCVGMALINSLIVSIIGGVVSYYICKWLDSDE